MCGIVWCASLGICTFDDCASLVPLLELSCQATDKKRRKKRPFRSCFSCFTLIRQLSLNHSSSRVLEVFLLLFSLIFFLGFPLIVTSCRQHHASCDDVAARCVCCLAFQPSPVTRLKCLESNDMWFVCVAVCHCCSGLVPRLLSDNAVFLLFLLSSLLKTSTNPSSFFFVFHVIVCLIHVLSLFLVLL